MCGKLRVFGSFAVVVGPRLVWFGIARSCIPIHHCEPVCLLVGWFFVFLHLHGHVSRVHHCGPLCSPFMWFMVFYLLRSSIVVFMRLCWCCGGRSCALAFGSSVVFVSSVLTSSCAHVCRAHVGGRGCYQTPTSFLPSQFSCFASSI